MNKDITVNLETQFNCDGHQVPMPKYFDFSLKLDVFLQRNGELGHYGDPKVGKIIKFKEVEKNKKYILTFDMYKKFKDLKFDSVWVGLLGVTLFPTNGLVVPYEFGRIEFIYYKGLED